MMSQITGPSSTKWQNIITTLFLGIKIPTTKHEIMLHAISLNLPNYRYLLPLPRNVCISMTSLFTGQARH